MRVSCVRPWIAPLALATTLGGPPEAAAQERPTVRVGTRVRVATDTGATLLGSVTALTRTELELQGEGGGQPFPVPLAYITRLEVSHGESMAALGFVLGATVGALGAVAYCRAEEDNCVYTHLNGGRNDLNAALPLVLGVLGGVAGALAGREIRNDSWEDVPLDRLEVSLSPGGDGRLGLGFSVRF